MKFIFTLVLALMFQIASHAASPSFDSFNTNQFVVSASKIISDRLWTNNAGTIQASSPVADGASAVGFSLNSSNTLSAAGAKIATFSNHGTNKVTITPLGGLFIGDQSESWWGALDNFIVDYEQIDAGGLNSVGTFQGAFTDVSNSDGASVSLFAEADGPPSSNIQASKTVAGLTSSVTLYTAGTSLNGSIESKVAGAQVFLLRPSSVDGNTPYIFDTSLTHTSGNLLEVKNNGANKFVVPFDGAVLTPSITTTNITVENNITVKGNAVLNVFTAQSGTVSNNLTVLGNYVGTIDPAQTGTTLKQIKSLKLQFPRLVDGAGCTYANTNDYTALTFMLPQFSGTGATNANYCDFAFRVPSDLDTSVDLTASLTVRLTAADTSGHTYDVGMVSIANSGAAAGTPANYVALTVTGDGSGASGDIESVSAVTLTSWKSNLTAGQWCLLRLNRDGANDASTVASNLMELEIFYTSTQ